jgi:hypothetical protein
MAMPLPGGAAEPGQEAAVPEELPTDDFRERPGPVAVGGTGVQDLALQELLELQRTALDAAGAKTPALAGVGQEVVIAAVLATDAGETPAEIAAGEEALDNLLHDRPIGAVARGEALVVDALELLEVIAQKKVERRPQAAGAVDGAGLGCGTGRRGV